MRKEKKKCPPMNWKAVREFHDPNKKNYWLMQLAIDFENHKYPTTEKLFAKFFKILFYVPIIRKAVDNSVGGTFGTFIRHWKAKDYQAAYDVSLRKLKDETLRKSEGRQDHSMWWIMMEQACQSAEILDSLEKKQELVQTLLEGPEPLQGYHVSFAFCCAARWSYAMHQVVQALDFARRARDADPTYEYAWFLLGWFSLVMNRADVESYFLKAIELEPQSWSMISQDNMCSNETEMLRSLKEKALAKGIAVKV